MTPTKMLLQPLFPLLFGLLVLTAPKDASSNPTPGKEPYKLASPANSGGLQTSNLELQNAVQGTQQHTANGNSDSTSFLLSGAKEQIDQNQVASNSYISIDNGNQASSFAYFNMGQNSLHSSPSSDESYNNNGAFNGDGSLNGNGNYGQDGLGADGGNYGGTVGDLIGQGSGNGGGYDGSGSAGFGAGNGGGYDGSGSAGFGAGNGGGYDGSGSAGFGAGNGGEYDGSGSAGFGAGNGGGYDGSGSGGFGAGNGGGYDGSGSGGLGAENGGGYDGSSDFGVGNGEAYGGSGGFGSGNGGGYNGGSGSSAYGYGGGYDGSSGFGAGNDGGYNGGSGSSAYGYGGSSGGHGGRNTVTSTSYTTGKYHGPYITKYRPSNKKVSLVYKPFPIIAKPVLLAPYYAPRPQKVVAVPVTSSGHGLDLSILDKILPQELLNISPSIKLPSSANLNAIQSLLLQLFNGPKPVVSVSMTDGPNPLDVLKKLLEVGEKSLPSIKLNSHSPQSHRAPVVATRVVTPVVKTVSVPKVVSVAPTGPNINIVKHLPSVFAKIKLPDLGSSNLLDSLSDLIKLPKIELAKKEKVVVPVVRRPVYVAPKPRKIVTAYPLHKGVLSGHVVVEDYPYGKPQYGPYDDGGEAELGCAELDTVIPAPAVLVKSGPKYSRY